MKEIKTLLVGVLGVLLVSGAFTAPAYARSFDTSTINKDGTVAVSQQQTGNTTQVQYGSGIVASIEDVSKLSEGWNVVNGDPNKIVLNQNGKLASGWINRSGWRYFDPVTHYMVRDQAKVINGKEYFFNCSGDMVANTNVGNAYYGFDGARNGSARQATKTTGTYTTVGIVKGLNTSIPYQEFENLVNQGHIKASVSYGSTGGGVLQNSLDFSYVG